MKRTLLKHIMVSMAVLAASCAVLSAQDIKTVTGKIINTTTGRPFDPVTVMIMAYNTVGEAEDCRASLQSGVGDRQRCGRFSHFAVAGRLHEAA